MCNIEFPHFGASYPDAHCINGYLWDMDSYENGCYTIGGDDPCPFCNTEAWLKTVLDNEEFASREEALEWVEKMREKWGAKHLATSGKTSGGSSEIPKDLEEAAKHHSEQYRPHWPNQVRPAYDSFIAGYNLCKEQMLKEAVEGEVVQDLKGVNRVKSFGKIPEGLHFGDKVRIIVCKNED